MCKGKGVSKRQFPLFPLPWVGLGVQLHRYILAVAVGYHVWLFKYVSNNKQEKQLDKHHATYLFIFLCGLWMCCHT